MIEEKIKVIDPIRDAFDFVVKALFKPFYAEKWVIWGFIAFFGANFNAGYSFFYRLPIPNSFQDGDLKRKIFSSAGRDPISWFSTHLGLITFFVILGLFISAVIVLVITYLRSRGSLMYVECVVYDKLAIKESWRNNRKEALALFLWYILFATSIFVFILAAIASFAIAALSIKQLTLRIIAFVSIGWSILSMALFISLINLFFKDFITPIIWNRKISVIEGWKVFLNYFDLYAEAFGLYALIRILISSGANVLISIGSCLTCCIGALPVIRQIFFQPVYLFFREYPLHILSQIDPLFSDRFLSKQKSL